MPHFNEHEMIDLVNGALTAVAAPVSSVAWRSTPETIRELFVRGDTGDAWVFTTLVINKFVKLLGMESCPCGNPDHKPEVTFGFMPVVNGHANPDRIITADSPQYDDLPEEVRAKAPAVRLMVELIEAEIEHDNARSFEVWEKILEARIMSEIMFMVLQQAGEVTRSVVAQEGLN